MTIQGTTATLHASLLEISITLTVLALLMLLLTLMDEGWSWLSYFLYSGRAKARVCGEELYTLNHSKGLVEKLTSDGTYQPLQNTQDRSNGKLPFYYFLFERNKYQYILEWPAQQTLWHGHYRYLKRKGAWQIGDIVEIHYQPQKPWRYSVHDPAHWKVTVLKLLLELTVLLAAILLWRGQI